MTMGTGLAPLLLIQSRLRMLSALGVHSSHGLTGKRVGQIHGGCNCERTRENLDITSEQG